jgi:meso-butanediol dehydrogenase/(S,S)-butanediol dehydrogenase/diacetyl reductase
MGKGPNMDAQQGGTGRLNGRVALITGTGGGQGRAAALRFAAEGALVVGCDVGVEGDAETARLVRAAGGRIDIRDPVDLGDPDACQDWIEWAASLHGRIDILYNNASRCCFAPFEEMTLDAWRETIRNELDLVFFACKFAWPHLKKQGGVIINIASIVGVIASDTGRSSAHGAAKGGVISLTRQLAFEGAPHGIRVVAISPGTIVTPGTQAILAEPAVRERLLDKNMIRRLGTPEEIVGIAAMLASDDGAFITGENIIVDGGRVAG